MDDPAQQSNECGCKICIITQSNLYRKKLRGTDNVLLYPNIIALQELRICYRIALNNNNAGFSTRDLREVPVGACHARCGTCHTRRRQTAEPYSVSRIAPNTPMVKRRRQQSDFPYVHNRIIICLSQLEESLKRLAVADVTDQY